MTTPFQVLPRAKELKGIPLLPKYKCRVCSDVKSVDCFSQKELKNYAEKVKARFSVNFESANLRCRNCSGFSRHELQCEGQCGIWKELEAFSKSSRSAGGSKWCIQCTLWKEAQEPGVSAQHPDTNKGIAYDEVAFSYDDPEAGDGSDEDWYPNTSSPGASHASAVLWTSTHTNPAATVQQDLSMMPLSGTHANSARTSIPAPPSPPASNSYDTDDEWSAVAPRRRGVSGGGSTLSTFHNRNGIVQSQEKYPSSSSQSATTSALATTSTAAGLAAPTMSTPALRDVWVKPIDTCNVGVKQDNTGPAWSSGTPGAPSSSKTANYTSPAATVTALAANSANKSDVQGPGPTIASQSAFSADSFLGAHAFLTNTSLLKSLLTVPAMTSSAVETTPPSHTNNGAPVISTASEDLIYFDSDEEADFYFDDY